jgi:hypothetical protein
MTEGLAVGDLAGILGALSNLSFMFGPFFFSLLFMLFITRKAHRDLQSVIRREAPPADDIEKSFYRKIHTASLVSGIILVFISVAWWVYAQFKIHAYSGVIVGLNPNEIVYSVNGDMWSRTVNKRVSDGERSLKEFHFVVIKNSRLAVGQTLEFEFYKSEGGVGQGPPKQIKLFAKLTGHYPEQFKLTRKNGKLELVSMTKE